MTALNVQKGFGSDVANLRGSPASLPVAFPDMGEISQAHLAHERRLIGGLIERAAMSTAEQQRIDGVARRLVEAARTGTATSKGIEAFLQEYGLSSEEGVLLMCVAESLLRIPDRATADKLIAEKLGEGAWEKHLGHSGSLLVNASTWGLLLTGRVVRLKQDESRSPLSALKRLVAGSGEPVIRSAVRQAVQILANQFVLGQTIKEALKRAQPFEKQGCLFSYDMLGEAAKTDADAELYFARYLSAIEAVGAAAGPLDNPHPQYFMGRPGISIKLSALHPRFEPGKDARLDAELVPRLMALLKAARAAQVPVTIDTEEQDRLEPTLRVFARCFLSSEMADWNGLGMAVQAYGKRAVPVLRWLRKLAHQGGRMIPVRLVKGAYWDSEIKWAQQRGWEDYPVFTRKVNTDVSYLACARLLLSDPQAFYPQFATHNAHTLASVHVFAGKSAHEFQRLHGMGEVLYDDVLADDKLKARCRIYAPVGGHEDLLAYLVRRLLENGANTSFVHQLGDAATPIDEIVANPVTQAEARLHEPSGAQAHSGLIKPPQIYQPDRAASAGLALTQNDVRARLVRDIETALEAPFEVMPLVGGAPVPGGNAAPRDVVSPHDFRVRLGTVVDAGPDEVEAALTQAVAVFEDWERTGFETRAAMLELAADRLEKERARFMAVLIREAGKTIITAHDEVREAVDFLRYYASDARRLLAAPLELRSPTGETNLLSLRAHGPFAIICPWNFPLAILVGQAAAALVTGNPVIIKSSEHTPIMGQMAVDLLHRAGIPGDVVQLLPGDGQLGDQIVRDTRICGVAFTGSSETAWKIQAALAARRSAIVPFIAETGGINAMIADSSALPEQVVSDCVRSAFDSAGQRCSAARVLFVQEEIADRTIAMLVGAVDALDLGDPLDFATDIGPVINDAAQDGLDAHKLLMRGVGKELFDTVVPEPCRPGTYVTPAVFEVGSLEVLQREIFGPILHVVRYQAGHLEDVVSQINELGFGLTLGLHTRIQSVADQVARSAKVGNLYVNRDQVGAVVGVQPFGGEGLSGTGPKAGGPNYLVRFMTERVVSTNITATGGNMPLLKQVGTIT
ncbi:MAG: bifunctional proline dehydrogenase/L-glutamate gamma-semialdehyde dehydrogenase PutA [Pseudomonadota bacterium]